MIITDYSNQLHQLLVSVSRHLYITKDGFIKYQEKPAAAVSVKDYRKAGRERLVYYVLRDHFSGSFVFQVASTKSLIPLAEFLFYVWREDAGEEKFLWGMPESLSIPKNISSPGLYSGVEKLGIRSLNPPSGFDSGIRVLRDIEGNLCFLMHRTVDHTVAGLNGLRQKVYRYLINSSYRDNKFERWKECLPAGHPRNAPDKEIFMRYFTAGAGDDGGLPLTGLPDNQKMKQKINKNSLSGVDANSPLLQEKLSQAQDLIYDAWELGRRDMRLDLARKALSISPYCADAYVLLARESDYPQEALELYKKGVQAGRLALGEKKFEEYAGHFWGFIETRPYMRALYGMAEGLWKLGERAEALEHFRQMLRLNPNDNQGVRYTLLYCLLAEGLDEEAGQLLAENASEETCFMAYSRALWYFRKQGGGRESNNYLKIALDSNSHVPEYLLKKRSLPFKQPPSYALGSPDEAIIYVSEAKEAWEKTPGALEWLAGADLPLLH